MILNKNYDLGVGSLRIILTVALLFTVGILYCQDLVILYTNDTHSHIETETSGKYKGLGGAQRRADYIKWARANQAPVLLVDAGDFNQGSPYYTLFHGKMEVELFNAMRYDAVALGNHEFDNGETDLAERLKNAFFDVVCANYDFTNSPLGSIVKPYTIVRKGGYKIGIIGVLVNLTGFVSNKSRENIKYMDPVEPVNSIAAKLKKDEKCDLVIVLSHLGYSPDGDNPMCDIELAKHSRNVDIIIGGHSHTFLPKPESFENADGREIVVTQMGFAGYYLGRLNLNKK